MPNPLPGQKWRDASGGLPFEQRLGDLIGERRGRGGEVTLSGRCLGVEMLFSLVNQIARTAPRFFELCILFANPLAPRFFLLLINLFASFAQRNFDGLRF